MKALILGVTGQDGSYLAELLLAKGYEVHGLLRRSATGNTRNIEGILDKLVPHRGDLADPLSLHRVVSHVRPDEIYNEADQDHVAWSFDAPGYSYDITGAAVGRLLEIVRQVDSRIKVFQPCTSNMFGRAVETPQHEDTPFRPQSPYACAKVLAFVLARHYRETYGMFVCTGILYNHESPRRTEEYVTRKITRAAARIKLGLQDTLRLGDLGAEVDWGYAGEYMDAAWRMMQASQPDDYVIATGETHSVREWLETAFALVGLDPARHVRHDETLRRPTATSLLRGDASRARKAFGFDPRIRFRELVKLMVDADLRSMTTGGRPS
jgi:GDPmannose 4,6-dehydratase